MVFWQLATDEAAAATSVSPATANLMRWYARSCLQVAINESRETGDYWKLGFFKSDCVIHKPTTHDMTQGMNDRSDLPRRVSSRKHFQEFVIMSRPLFCIGLVVAVLSLAVTFVSEAKAASPTVVVGTLPGLEMFDMSNWLQNLLGRRAINPQPLPPGRGRSINPQPLPPG
jgi:hypothetical protein